MDSIVTVGALVFLVLSYTAVVFDRPHNRAPLFSRIASVLKTSDGVTTLVFLVGSAYWPFSAQLPPFRVVVAFRRKQLLFQRPQKGVDPYLPSVAS
jgi:hypothetical protein